MKTVRFKNRYGIYMPGDTAAFPDDEADRIVMCWAAVPVEEQATAPACEVSAVKVEHPEVPQETAAGRRRRR
jgi:hypothetical protein